MVGNKINYQICMKFTCDGTKFSHKINLVLHVRACVCVGIWGLIVKNKEAKPS